LADETAYEQENNNLYASETNTNTQDLKFTKRVLIYNLEIDQLIPYQEKLEKKKIDYSVLGDVDKSSDLNEAYEEYKNLMTELINLIKKQIAKVDSAVNYEDVLKTREYKVKEEELSRKIYIANTRLVQLSKEYTNKLSPEISTSDIRRSI